MPIVAQRRRADLFTLSAVTILAALLLSSCGDSAAPTQSPTPAIGPLQPQTPPLEATAPPSATRAALPMPTEAAESTPRRSPSATTLPNPEAFVQIAAGENHSCALKHDGQVLCWGPNDQGQLDVPSGVRFRQITSGWRFSCGIRTDGGITCWGRNNHKQTEAPEGEYTALDAGWEHVCAISRVGATCWGRNANGRATPPTGVLFKAIGSGAEHSCGLTLDEDLTCWGKNDDGRAKSRTGPFRALAVSIAYTCVLHHDGTVLCQGEDTAGQHDPPNATFAQISASSDYVCGILSTGLVECWGGNQRGTINSQLAAPSGIFTSLSAGWKNMCGLTEHGNIQCWGYTPGGTLFSPYDRSNFAVMFPDHSFNSPLEHLDFIDAFPGRTFDQPVEILPWPSGGFAVANRTGSIVAHIVGSQPLEILDLSRKLDSSGAENGLLSAAIDPEFVRFPFLYIFYTVKSEKEGGRSSVQLSRFPVVNGRAVREEELVILNTTPPRQARGHWGGAIRFGPDGMLYLGIGDGDCFECPQDLDTLHGKIIRIDVRDASTELPYRIPDDNPLLGVKDARSEIWAYGVRNPWRMAFDQQDGSLWVGDVGQVAEEEVTIATAGANLGWPIFEGANCFNIGDAPASQYGVVAEYPCSEFEGLTAPVATYGRTEGCAIIGGTVYRGAAIPWLDGIYVFGDYCSGRVWALDGDADSGWQMIQIADLDKPLTSFGTDAAGEVYVLTFGGPILRLVLADSGYAAPARIVPAVTTPPAGGR